MKNTRAFIVLAFLALAAFAVSAADTPPAAYLPGVLQADSLPNGCVSCHAGDYSIPKELAKVKGHPDVSKVVKSVPDGCLMCHKAGAKVPTLASVVHIVHYGPTADKTAANHFVTAYAGSCLNCHTLDLKTGVMSFKKGAANW
jgi:hypothetical protein